MILQVYLYRLFKKIDSKKGKKKRKLLFASFCWFGLMVGWFGSTSNNIGVS